MMEEAIPMAARQFKVIFREDRPKINGKTQFIIKEGVNGTGLTLPFSCGFCCDKNGTPRFAFRSRRERNRHTNKCGTSQAF
jgi:hypothetical protein